jgi:ribosome biogenesis GTPase / thiamine phosphate phosphatase
MKSGILLKGVGGYYTTLYDGDKRCVLKARGKFRHADETPLPGDRVLFLEPPDGHEGAMEELLPRKNLMLRPRVANVDLLCAVVSASLPPPDFLLLDKLCANAVSCGIAVVCAMNKAEQATEGLLESFLRDYTAFSPLRVSARTGEGLPALQLLFSKKTVCFAGQSGVGKSSLLNRLLPGHKNFETGTLSERSQRGKQTTRHAELVPIEGGGILVDTPGFSLMDLPLMQPEELKLLYPEFLQYDGNCRFAGCLHVSEPDCAVKAAVKQGFIPRARHARYVELLKDVQLRWRNRYE